MDKSSQLELSTKLVAANLSREEISDPPGLSIYTTTNKRTDSESFTSFIYKDQSGVREIVSELSPISINLGVSEIFPPDSRLHFQFWTYRKNKLGDTSVSKAGIASVLISDIQKSVRVNKPILIPLTLQQKIDKNGNAFTKAVVSIKVKYPERTKTWTFKNIEKTHILPCNNEFVSDKISNYAENIFQKSRSYMQSEETKKVILPIIEDVVPTTTQSYFVNRNFGLDKISEEIYFGDLLDLSIRRLGYDKNEMNELIKTCRTKKRYSCKLKKAVDVLGTMLAIRAVSRPYMGDSVNIENQKISIEDFNLPSRSDNMMSKSDSELLFSSADCEDGGIGITQHSIRFRSGKFGDPVLENFQWLSQRYVFGGVLATVSGAEIKDSDGNPKTLYIDTPDYNSLKSGAHIFCLAFPNEKFKKMTKNYNLISKYYDDKYSELESELPNMILEGTGSVTPSIFPDQTYYDDEEDIKEAFVQHKKKMISYEELLNAGECFKDAVYQRFPGTLADEPNKAAPFYRIATDFYTSDFDEELGDQFGFFNTSGSEHSRGINIRHLVLDENRHVDLSKETSYSFPVLKRIQSMNEDTRKVFVKLSYQIPHCSPEKISDEDIEYVSTKPTDQGINRTDVLYEFKQQAKKILSGRNVDDKRNVQCSFTFLGDHFFDDHDKRKNIIDLIKKNNYVRDIDVNLITLGSKIKMVDLYLKVDSDMIEKKESLKSTVQSEIFPWDIFEYDTDPFNFDELFREGNEIENIVMLLQNINQKQISLFRTDFEKAREKDVSNLWGFGAIIYLLNMPHIKEMVKRFIMIDTDKYMMFPFIYTKGAMRFKSLLNNYNNSKKLHEIIISDILILRTYDMMETYSSYKKGTNLTKVSIYNNEEMFHDDIPLKPQLNEMVIWEKNNTDTRISAKFFIFIESMNLSIYFTDSLYVRPELLYLETEEISQQSPNIEILLNMTRGSSKVDMVYNVTDTEAHVIENVLEENVLFSNSSFYSCACSEIFTKIEDLTSNGYSVENVQISKK